MIEHNNRVFNQEQWPKSKVNHFIMGGPHYVRQSGMGQWLNLLRLRHVQPKPFSKVSIEPWATGTPFVDVAWNYSKKLTPSIGAVSLNPTYKAKPTKMTVTSCSYTYCKDPFNLVVKRAVKENDRSELS